MDVIGCAICFEKYSDKQPGVITRCGHVFDQECLLGWLLGNQTCPSCRSSCNRTELSKVHFALVPGILDSDATKDLRDRLEQAQLNEAKKSSELDELQKELELVRIEKETLLKDCELYRKRLNNQISIQDKENIERAKALSISGSHT